MEQTTHTSEQLLREIVEKRGIAYLREGNGKFFVNAFAEMSGDRQDVTLLRYLIQCGGHEDILNAANLSPAMQRTYYSQTVQKLCDRTLIPEALAHRICAIFWQAVYGKEPPQYDMRHPEPAPQPVKTEDELYQEAQNCRDHAQKLILLRQAASQGHLDAMLHLGFAYEYGNDPKEACRWFRQAADQGFAPAQDRMAYCYDKGFGVEQDLDKAIEWCQKAKNQNFPGAARHLHQLEEKKWRETPDISGNKPEFEILNGALLKYNGSSRQVTVPGDVTRIGAKAFFGNDTIRSVKLPYGLLGMSAQAFAGCSNLREITIPGSVIAVNLDLFNGCRKLKKVTLESGVRKINFGKHLDQLGSVCVVIPDSVSSVTWSHMPDSQRTERMKHPKGILASKGWTDLLQDFFSKNPDFRPGKIWRVGAKQVALGVLAALLVFGVSSIVTDSESGQTRRDFAPFRLEESVEDTLLAGTEAVYTYPDNTRMEFYYDDAGKEICRIYVNSDDEIQYLFDARYDSVGRLVYHQIFDGQGSLLRTDSYDFHSSADTAQRRITLPDGRNLQGVSVFDENGYETFTLTHEDGTQTVFRYTDDGVLTDRKKLDTEGEAIVDDPSFRGIDWENVPKVFGPRETVIGFEGDYGSYYYVQGLCGGALKEYSVSDDAAFVDTYDPLGKLLETLYYRGGQLNELGSQEVYHFDAQGNSTGYTETYYTLNGNYSINLYDKNGFKISSEYHHGEDVSYERYETDLDDQGRETCIRTFDGRTNRPISVDETEYDGEGNVGKKIRTFFHEDGSYNITIKDGKGKITSDNTYYPSGNIESVYEYNSEGKRIKWTRYYESGQVKRVAEYNDAGETIGQITYYENGQTEFLYEYSADGKRTKETSYYENGQIHYLHEYNDQGVRIKSTTYYENGQIRHLVEYNNQGERIKNVLYDENGTIVE